MALGRTTTSSLVPAPAVSRSGTVVAVVVPAATVGAGVAAGSPTMVPATATFCEPLVPPPELATLPPGVLPGSVARPAARRTEMVAPGLATCTAVMPVRLVKYPPLVLASAYTAASS